MPAWTARSEPGAEIGGALEGLEPLELRVVTEPHEVARWNELLDRHHYLGYRRPVGPHLRYAIVDRRGRWLGCLLFSYAARSLPCRDDFIGWDEAARRKRLDRVLGNPRFLILPWVRVGNLASKALSLATRRLADDWKARHGYRPVLVEALALDCFSILRNSSLLGKVMNIRHLLELGIFLPVPLRRARWT